MKKWDGDSGTFNPNPINRKKYSFLGPNLEFNIEVNNSYLLKKQWRLFKQLPGLIFQILQTVGMNDILGIQCKGVDQQFLSVGRISSSPFYESVSIIRRSSPYYFSLDLTIQINLLLASSVQWYNFNFWALAQSDEWNRKFWDF